MQSAHPGLISTTLGRLVPISKFLEKVGLRSVVVQAATSAIRAYQRYVSPHKGFSCAHRKLHGGESCSAHFRSLVLSYGLSQAVPRFQQRLEECRQAHTILKMARSQTGIGEGGEAEPDLDPLEEEKRQRRKASNSDSPVGDWCSYECNSCTCDGLQLPLWGCDSNHNGGCDSGDCGGIDLPCDGCGCDCGL